MANWSPQQEQALTEVDDWYKNRKSTQQTFYLAGWAGTGKTTLARHFAEGIDGTVKFACFTGKAAHVMAQKGCVGASTIHKMIYRPKQASKTRLYELQLELDHHKAAPEPNWDVIDSLLEEIGKEKENAGRMSFALNLESDLRFAKLLIIDECFVKGTLVNTPIGLKCIEEIKAGDQILNALGIDTIVRVSKKEVQSGIKIKAGGKTITCSEDHIFFTERGEVRARNLRLGERLATLSESMRLLQKEIQSERPPISQILQSSLRAAMVSSIPRVQSTVYERTCSKMRHWKKEVLEFWNSRSITTNKDICRNKTRELAWHGQANKRNTQTTWPYLQKTWRKWNWAYQTTVRTFQNTETWLENGTYCQYQFSWRELSSSLQNRYRKCEKEDCYRDRWEYPSKAGSKRKGYKENQPSEEIRVESITILEQGHSELDQFRDSEGKLYLYDLTAARHSSFAVEGILVHNCSMVSAGMGKDLESFGVPILVLGDPEQLPPIYGAGYFTEKTPDIILDEIHRQALDNPIIGMSKLVREGKELPLGNYGESRVINEALPGSEILDHDIILTGLRKTKKTCDDKCRSLLKRTSVLPQAGDNVICVKNNHFLGLLNGQMWTVMTDAIPMGSGEVSLHLKNPDTDEELAVSAAEKLFTGQSLDRWEHEEDIEEFEYAYAITVHKSQGSQWDNVLLFDQKHRFPNWDERDRRRWLYTGITRAANRITVMRL